MGYLQERIKHAVRFRHKRGYGVHSPFMFNLILNVIRDRQKRFSYPIELANCQLLNRRERKILQLLVRLVQYLQVKKVVCLGANSFLLTEYLSVGCRKAEVCNDMAHVGEADFIYVGRRTKTFGGEQINWESLLQAYPKYVVLADIYKDKKHLRLWKKLKERATVSVDMMWFGLLFFDDKIQKGRYNLII